MARIPKPSLSDAKLVCDHYNGLLLTASRSKQTKPQLFEPARVNAKLARDKYESLCTDWFNTHCIDTTNNGK